MRIGELSIRTGVPVPTIKYYLREGLLPAGERTRRNQSHYVELHLRRIRLIRALLEIGGLSITAIRDILAAVDTPGISVHDVLGRVQYAVTHSERRRQSGEWKSASQEVADLVERRGWRVKARNPGWTPLVLAVAMLRGMELDDLAELLDQYAEAAERLAAAELAIVGLTEEADARVEKVIMGTMFGDVAMSALRRLAQEDASLRLPGTREPER